MRNASVLLAIWLVSAAPAGAQQRGTGASPDFPVASIADTRSLEFHVSQPSAGPLETQVRTAVRYLAQKNHGAKLVKLRIFAIGTAALEASRVAVARALADAKAPLPVLSLVGVAGFPDTAQLVEIESTAAGGRTANPHGVGFMAGVAAPTGERAIGGLARVTKEAGITDSNVLRVSCFYEQTDQVAQARPSIATTFPKAEASFVFSFAASARPLMECEAMARLDAIPVPTTRYFNLSGVAPSPSYSHATLVGPTSVVFTASQVASDASDSAMHVMFERTQAAVARFGASLSNVVMGDNYWLTDAARDTLRLVRAQYFGGTVPAATGVFFTALASAGAPAAIELVVAVEPPRPDTVTLLPGSDAMDGRYLKPHLAEVTRTVTKGGIVALKDHYTLDKSVTEERGKQMFHLVVHALADAPDPSLQVTILLDHRTMALVRREEHSGNGREAVFEVEGAHVAGSIKPASDSVAVPVDFTLTEPAFLASFIDAAANAAQLRQDQVLRIPTFGLAPGQRQVAWHYLRVVARDTVRVGDHLANAWVVEESPGATFTSRQIWVLREPPYFPREVTVLSDGSIQRVEQRLPRQRG